MASSKIDIKEKLLGLKVFLSIKVNIYDKKNYDLLEGKILEFQNKYRGYNLYVELSISEFVFSKTNIIKNKSYKVLQEIIEKLVSLENIVFLSIQSKYLPTIQINEDKSQEFESKEISISNIRKGLDGLFPSDAFKKLKYLKMNINLSGVTNFSPLLALENLEALDLSNCCLTEEFTMFISELLGKDKDKLKLGFLNISNNSILMREQDESIYYSHYMTKPKPLKCHIDDYKELARKIEEVQTKGVAIVFNNAFFGKSKIKSEIVVEHLSRLSIYGKSGVFNQRLKQVKTTIKAIVDTDDKREELKRRTAELILSADTLEQTERYLAVFDRHRSGLETFKVADKLKELLPFYSPQKLILKTISLYQSVSDDFVGHYNQSKVGKILVTYSIDQFSEVDVLEKLIKLVLKYKNISLVSYTIEALMKAINHKGVNKKTSEIFRKCYSYLSSEKEFLIFLANYLADTRLEYIRKYACTRHDKLRNKSKLRKVCKIQKNKIYAEWRLLKQQSLKLQEQYCGTMAEFKEIVSNTKDFITGIKCKIESIESQEQPAANRIRP